jgi:hypothetical protein
MLNTLFDNVVSIVGYKQKDYITMSRAYINM